MKIIIVGTVRIFEVRVIDDQVSSRLTRLVHPTRVGWGKRRGFRMAQAPAAAIEPSRLSLVRWLRARKRNTTTRCTVARTPWMQAQACGRR